MLTNMAHAPRVGCSGVELQATRAAPDPQAAAPWTPAASITAGVGWLDCGYGCGCCRIVLRLLPPSSLPPTANMGPPARPATAPRRKPAGSAFAVATAFHWLPF